MRLALDKVVNMKRFPLEGTTEGKRLDWSLAKRWVAGGVAMPEEGVAPRGRLVARSPGGAFRDRIPPRLVASAHFPACISRRHREPDARRARERQARDVRARRGATRPLSDVLCG